MRQEGGIHRRAFIGGLFAGAATGFGAVAAVNEIGKPEPIREIETPLATFVPFYEVHFNRPNEDEQRKTRQSERHVF